MMISKLLYKLLLISFFFLANVNSYSQNLPLVEVSAKKKEMYQSMLENNRTLVSFIENTLAQNGLPKMMRNLALIESGFDKNVVSSAKAVGIWQFMKTHAAHYGLPSEKRSDVYHSTQTVTKTLKSLYNKYGNWIMVVAAYNCGEGNVRKAMDKGNSDKYEKIYRFLPSETVNHIQKFMEACAVTGELNFLLTDYKLSAFKEKTDVFEIHIEKNDPSLLSTTINAAYDLHIIAGEMGLDFSDLLMWNPEINEKLMKEGVAKLYLPVDKMPDFLLLKNIILDRSLKKVVDND